jgi:hypothetical protein
MPFPSYQSRDREEAGAKAFSRAHANLEDRSLTVAALFGRSTPPHTLRSCDCPAGGALLDCARLDKRGAPGF